MIKISAFASALFGEMTYIVWDTDSLQAVIVDPGMFGDEEARKVDDFIEGHKLHVTHIINTHLHLDHIFGANHASARYGVGMSAHPADAFLGRSLPEQMREFHIHGDAAPVEITNPLHDGDVIPVGSATLHVLEVPGHSPGSIALYCPEAGFVLVGDTLFKRSVGRTDLEGGDSAALARSIREKLFTLPDNTLVIPGHGPTTTIGEEKRSNPFV